jgi:hypothetical protein
VVTPDGGVEPGCQVVQQDLRRFPADLLVVLDRSRSMARRTAGTSHTLFEEMTAALDETAAGTAGIVRWSLKMFPTVAGCDVSPGVEVEAADDPAALRAALMTASPAFNEGGTPARAAVLRASEHLASHRTGKLQYMVLATDGAPTCGSTGTDGRDTDATVAALARAADMGLHTFVVGIAVDGSREQSALNQMAVAGGEPRPGTLRYHDVRNREELTQALAPIVSYVSCSARLATPVEPDESILVTVDGQDVPRSDEEGWRLSDNGDAVTLNGSYCARVRNHEANDFVVRVACR